MTPQPSNQTYLNLLVQASLKKASAVVSINNMSCQYLGCTLPVFAGSSFCSKSHRDAVTGSAAQAPAGSNSTGTPTISSSSGTCQYPSCSKPVYPGSPYCSRAHRDAVTTAQPKSGGLLSRGPGQILFYDRGQPYFEFTNFSDHPIRYNGKDYPTSEHLFQSLKRQFEDNTLIEMIRTQPTPRAAFDMAQKYKTSVRPGWHDKQLNIKMMEKAVLLKFTQHEDLRKILVSTGDALLKENSPTDRFWGIGTDGRGENRLGLALMKVRELLKTFEK